MIKITLNGDTYNIIKNCKCHNNYIKYYMGRVTATLNKMTYNYEHSNADELQFAECPICEKEMTVKLHKERS